MQIDPAKFRSLVEQHQSMVFSIALRVTGEYGVAEEVAQDAFLELHKSGARLESDDHVRFWLRRVTVHRATDALRSRKRRPESAADEWVEEEHTGVAGNQMDFAIAARLDELLGSLPEAMRVAVVLRYQEEMSPDEIAAMLGQPLATVKSHLQRGLKLMRQKAATTMKEYVRAGFDGMDEFEAQLQRAMKRVDARPEAVARFMAIAGQEQSEAKVPWLKRGFGWASLLPRPQVWAMAALLAVGVSVGEQVHLRNQARREAEARQQFEAAARVTDRALEHARAQLERAGLVLGN